METRTSMQRRRKRDPEVEADIKGPSSENSLMVSLVKSESNLQNVHPFNI